VKQDYRKASAVCDAAGTPDLSAFCYVGLGRNASGASAFQYEGIKKRCAMASAFGQPFCYMGAVRHLSYAPSELPRGEGFCKSIPAGDNRTRCWNGIGQQIASFFAYPAERRHGCQTESADDVSACLIGAGVESTKGTQ
jgi:hypothetical protein